MSTDLMNSREYNIRFARRRGAGFNADNLPIVITSDSWADYLNWCEINPDIASPVETTTGQVIWIQAADCGADCKCALEWWVEKD
jgi:accessory colonization factor AcfC